jgi:hypothetical protein
MRAMTPRRAVWASKLSRIRFGAVGPSARPHVLAAKRGQSPAARTARMN